MHANYQKGTSVKTSGRNPAISYIDCRSFGCSSGCCCCSSCSSGDGGGKLPRVLHAGHDGSCLHHLLRQWACATCTHAYGRMMTLPSCKSSRHIGHRAASLSPGAPPRNFNFEKAALMPSLHWCNCRFTRDELKRRPCPPLRLECLLCLLLFVCILCIYI